MGGCLAATGIPQPFLTWEKHDLCVNPGVYLLDISEDYLPDRCVHDPHLLDALEHAVKGALEPIHVDETDEFHHTTGV